MYLKHFLLSEKHDIEVFKTASVTEKNGRLFEGKGDAASPLNTPKAILCKDETYRFRRKKYAKFPATGATPFFAVSLEIELKSKLNGKCKWQEGLVSTRIYKSVGNGDSDVATLKSNRQSRPRGNPAFPHLVFGIAKSHNTPVIIPFGTSEKRILSASFRAAIFF